MAIPTSYTEAELAQYMARVLGPSNVDTLDWTAELLITAALQEYREPVYETLLALGGAEVSDYDTATEIQALRATARWQVWKHARMAVSDAYDESYGGGVSMKRSQLFEMAQRNEEAEYRWAQSAIGALSIVVSIVPAVTIDEDEAEFG